MIDISCEFCIEIDKPSESYFYKLFSSKGIQSRVLLEDSRFIAIPGLGSLTDGYVLLLPKQHSISLAYLTPDFLNEMDDLKSRILDFMKRFYPRIFCFEHGAASNTCRAGACVDHAHLHICPCTTDIEGEIDSSFEKVSLNTMSELKQFSEKNTPYIFFENQDGKKWAYLLPSRVESQYMRRIWAKALGKQDDWDWAVFTCYENILKTISLFQKEKKWTL